MVGELPDRVPVAPDISNYIPVGRSGRAFWEIYFDEEIPLWELYIDAADSLGIDFWIASCTSAPVVPDRTNVTVHFTVNAIAGDGDPRSDAMTRRLTFDTPDGQLTEEQICFRYEPPTHRECLIKDLVSDWPAYRWLLSPPAGLDRDEVERIRTACRRRNQAFGLGIGYPGFQSWEEQVDGSIQSLAFAEMDHPEILAEWHALHLDAGTRTMELLLAEKPDYVLFGGSGTLTLASPELARKYALPAISRWSAMARAAGVPTMLHSCGRSRALIDMLLEETQIDCVNPLEVPPMGDTRLAEVRGSVGNRISLMGNLHTTDLMLHGTPDQIYDASCTAIRDAGEYGRFILSTGDQCAPGTPEENLRAMVRAAEDTGVYDQKAGRLKARFP